MGRIEILATPLISCKAKLRARSARGNAFLSADGILFREQRSFHPLRATFGGLTDEAADSQQQSASELTNTAEMVSASVSSSERFGCRQSARIEQTSPELKCSNVVPVRTMTTFKYHHVCVVTKRNSWLAIAS
jgi:hypothetical protein